MATYLEIEEVGNTYNAKQRAIRLSRELFDLEKGLIEVADVTCFRFSISPSAIRYDENAKAVWGIECKPTDVVSLHESVTEQELLGVLCQILPHILVSQGVIYLQNIAKQLILWRDDEEMEVTMQIIASLSNGEFVEKTFKTDDE